jgi:hypothetical protein
MMDSQNGTREEIRETTHERVAQPAEMRTIPHFFGEDICWICLASNMNYFD